MANAVIKHFWRYEYLISNDVITLAKNESRNNFRFFRLSPYFD